MRAIQSPRYPSYTCVCVCVCIRMYMCVCVCVCVHARICAFVCAFVYIDSQQEGTSKPEVCHVLVSPRRQKRPTIYPKETNDVS